MVQSIEPDKKNNTKKMPESTRRVKARKVEHEPEIPVILCSCNRPDPEKKAPIETQFWLERKRKRSSTGR